MASSKFFLSLTLLFSSWVFLGFSQNLNALLAGLSAGGTGGEGGGASGGSSGGGVACAQKLLPCQAYLKPPSSPPDSCCSPLKQMIADDPTCLCGIFNNQDLLKTFHVTQDEALKLLGECGAKADISQCKNGTSGGSAPAASSNSTDPASNSTTAPTSSPTAPPPATPSDASSSDNTTTTKSSASEISLISGFGFVTLFASLFISAF